MSRWPVDPRGFVLLEAVVALVLVSLVGSAALALAAAALRSTSHAEGHLHASSLAQDRVNRARTLGGRVVPLPDSLRGGAFAPPFADYTWSMEAAEVRGEAGLVEVRVDVAWPSGRRTLVTRIHVGRLQDGRAGS